VPKPEDFILKESYMRLNFRGLRMQEKKITELFRIPPPFGEIQSLIFIDVSHLPSTTKYFFWPVRCHLLPTKMFKPFSVRILLIHGSKIHFKPSLHFA
jgi:hypothetical protein